MSRALALMATRATLDPAQLGRLMEPAEVARELFNGKVSAKWVLRNLPVHYRHRVGRLVLYYEGEVRLHIESLRQGA